jgi:hypothetical protein
MVDVSDDRYVAQVITGGDSHRYTSRVVSRRREATIVQ